MAEVDLPPEWTPYVPPWLMDVEKMKVIRPEEYVLNWPPLYQAKLDKLARKEANKKKKKKGD